MQTTKQPYEAPTIRESGEVVESTRANKTFEIEGDLSPMHPVGAVGFGV